MRLDVRTLCARALAALLVLSLPLGAGSARADVIDTSGAWDGSSFVMQFGVPNTATYGQTITVPLGSSRLQSFSFAMNLPATTIFRGEVYAWDGSKATGPSLYESGPRTTGGSGSFQWITFNTGGVNLTPGGQYVLFASVSKDYLAGSGNGSWGYLGGADVYPGGGFVYLNNGGDPSQWTSQTWSTWLGGGPDDLAFKASFNQAPEPGSLTLLGLGAATLAGWAWRRRRAH
jgi:hypothetical protein